MKRQTNQTPKATILVQIVHIEGTRKGDIDYFHNASITMGRNQKCDVVFPANELIVSRVHARIQWTGNNYILKNLGANGTFVNGKKISEIVLKLGDVITLAESGPKVSFLYEKTSKSANKRNKSVKLPTIPKNKKPKTPTLRSSNNPTTIRTTAPITAVKAEFTLQYATVIKSFHQHSISLGKGSDCDFIISHPLILDRHAEIYFSNNDYMIRDISGAQATLVNGRPIQSDTQLVTNDTIALNDNGPKFKYLGDGRLAELIEKQDLDWSLSQSISVNPINKSYSVKPTVMDVFKSVFTKK